MASIPILLLRLDGVLQSWGEHSKWNYRDSAAMPTKSGIVGLLGCALGLSRDDKKLMELQNNLQMAVRADRPGITMVDYHTISSKRLLNAEGKVRAGGDTILSYRTYLQDAYFTVALTGETETLKRLEEALNKPKWPIYLGRKSCVPSRPVCDGITTIYSSLEEALKKVSSMEKGEMMLEIDAAEGDNEIERRDVNAGYRIFRNRRVTRKVIIKESVQDVLD